ncbi:MAG: Gfo/Idh/MocA family oxidoreductase [Clostridia bacterium]|nr:Gfo/Idh/MocA family oxidoreductase [Clostridia bacterium]
MSKVRVGIFGCDRGGTMFWQMINHPDAEVVAICDKADPPIRRCLEAAEKLGKKVEVFRDFDEFVKYDMDAVVLANYATEHATYGVRCLEAGKHIMSEVLPGETPAQIVKLIETVERTGLVYSYAENYCYLKPTFEMWRRYRAGDIGEVQYAEGEYIHDSSAMRAELTQGGDRNHWRNLVSPTFYCTHSCGPIITITGLRPVKVVGFETNVNCEEKQRKIGVCTSSAVEIITLENGAIVKSVHGKLKMEPPSANYQVYGTKGMMQSKRYGTDEFNIYREGPKLCQGEWESYDPDIEMGKGIGAHTDEHSGSDFYPSHCFIQKILGRPDGDWAIDVYTASAMGMVGIMAWHSVLAGNKSMDIPDFRILSERDKFRHDNACTTPSVAGDNLLPMTSHYIPSVDDSVYSAMNDRFQGKKTFLDNLV